LKDLLMQADRTIKVLDVKCLSTRNLKMSSLVNYDDVLRTAQSLTEADRVRLVEELLGSLTPEDVAPLDEVWLAEIDRRSAEIDSGTIQTIPWDEVRRRARERAKLDG
jgi:putative addiction module component (TIGR02574 family)